MNIILGLETDVKDTVCPFAVVTLQEHQTHVIFVRFHQFSD